MKLSGLELTKEWATRSVAHTVSPEFASEFSKFGALARTVLFWRRRFEIQMQFLHIYFQKEFLLECGYVTKILFVCSQVN